MKELTLQELQNVSLEILNAIHVFCINNNIRYSLAYGTLLGAIRHKGFIPWDDDIDIMMPRPDYERFCKEFKSDNYELIKDTEQSYLSFSRVCDMNSTIAVTNTVWSKKQTGVWIDVFPLDGVEDNKQEFLERYNRVKRYWRRVLKCRGAASHINTQKSFYFKLRTVIKKIVFLNGISLFHYKTIQEAIMRQYDFNKSNYCSQLACPDDKVGAFIAVSEFNNLLLTKFNNYQFYVLNNYDELLKQIFGNYMELPPVEKRLTVARHARFFWK